MAHGSLNRRNFKGLQLNSAALASPVPDVADIKTAADEATVRRGLQAPNPDVNVDIFKIDSNDIETIRELGYGQSGSVSKVLHKDSGLYMAKKSVFLDARDDHRKLIVNELATLKSCDSDYIVRYYGQFLDKSQVVMCMEFMDCGSLDKIYKRLGPLPESILEHVNAAVVDGLVYLKNLKVTHRDIKPSNILVNHAGQIKLCDFGVSGVLINSMAQTYVGTSVYMSPERIQGEGYTDAGDVWSLGLSLVELARGKFPIAVSDDENMAAAPFEILQSIVEGPTPELPSNASSAFREYVAYCLEKDPKNRIKVRQLKNAPFYIRARAQPNPLPRWATSLERL